MKVMICCFGQETNTFSPKRLRYNEFLPYGWQTANRLIESYEGTKSYLGGAIDACREYDAEIVPLDSIAIDGGALMTRDCFEQCMEHLCHQIQENYVGTDGLFLAMHGAGRCYRLRSGNSAADPQCDWGWLSDHVFLGYSLHHYTGDACAF